MGVVYFVLILLALDLAAALWGVDSRPTDSERATRWFAGTPRD